MDQRAETRVPIHDLLATRRSPRAFDDRAVSAADVTALFEAARWAASAFNEQPWRFVYATRDDADGHARLASLLTGNNRRWAPAAPLLVLTVAATRLANGDHNRHAWHDVGLATGNLMAQATALGLAVHAMAGFDRARAISELGLPPDHEPVAMLAIGYPGAADRLPDDLAARERSPRSRKPLAEIAYPPPRG